MSNKTPRPANARRKYRMPPSEEIIDIKEAEQVRLRNEVLARINEMKKKVGLRQFFIDRAEGFAAKFSGIHLEEELFADCDTFELRRLAISGDAKAMGLLIRLTETFIETLNLIAAVTPERLRPVASINERWPVLYSPLPLLAKRNAALLHQIHFAEKAGSVLISKDAVITVDSTAKRFAMHLLKYIQALQRASAQLNYTKLQKAVSNEDDGKPDAPIFKQVGDDIASLVAQMTPDWPFECQRYTLDLLQRCQELPPFTDDEPTIGQWWAVAYALLMLNTDCEPQDKVQELYEVGRNRERHASGLANQNNSYGFNPGSVKSNVRGKLLTDLHEEFRRFANQLAKGKTNLKAEIRKFFGETTL